MFHHPNLSKDIRLEKCHDLIYKLSEDSIIRLYDAIDNYLFQDINLSMVSSALPIWVADGGVSAECPIDKPFLDKLKSCQVPPIMKKFIFYYDLTTIISAIQDRLQALDLDIDSLYSKVPSTADHEEDEYTSGVRQIGIEETYTHIFLNNVFISIAAIFDLLTKVCFEQAHISEYLDFRDYSKMKSTNVLFNVNDNQVDESLKQEGYLFAPSIEVKKIVTFRSEYVHNGAWDSRCAVYTTMINDEPADTLVYAPDVDENGRFVSSGSRNKFYYQRNRINVTLPDSIISILLDLTRTIDSLRSLFEQATKVEPSEEATIACLKEIKDFQTRFASSFQ